VYVAHSSASEVMTLTTDLEPLPPLPLSFHPYQLLLASVSGQPGLIVTNGDGGPAAVLSLPSGKKRCDLAAGYWPAYDPRTGKIYIANDGAKALFVFEGVTCKLTSTIQLPQFAAALAVDVAARRVYAALHHQDAIAVIDGDSGAIVDTWTGYAGNPTSLGFDDQARRLYVGFSLGNRVAEISLGDAASPDIQSRDLIVGDQPRFLAVDPGVHRVVVTVLAGAFLGLVQDQAIEAPLPLPYVAQMSAFDSLTHCVFSTSYGTAGNPQGVQRLCSFGP